MPHDVNTTYCAFVENKDIDFAQLESLLTPSASENHWANFGPASKALEQHIATLMDLPQGREAVVCKSGTDALFALTSIKSIHWERPLRWVVSAFGFFSTHIGPLAQSRIIDCDRRGLLSLAELMALDTSSWDGLIVTNVFGLFDDLSDYTELCADLGKAIIIDNAVGFKHAGRGRPTAADEIISFHQTKPWGMGEGGCLIVNAEDAALARSLINFGVDTQSKYRAYALNSKLPDISSALILQRLLDMPRWQCLYREQAARVIDIANKLQLPLLAPLPKDALVGNIPVVCPRPVSMDVVLTHNRPLSLGKYYQPLDKNNKQAEELYSRILNIPCHSQLAQLEDDQIVDSIRSLGGCG